MERTGITYGPLVLTWEVELSFSDRQLSAGMLGGAGGRHPVPGASGAHFLPTAAKIAGLYNDSEPPRKTMRRGVLMTLLQQSAMTLPLWIGKPGDK